MKIELSTLFFHTQNMKKEMANNLLDYCLPIDTNSFLCYYISVIIKEKKMDLKTCKKVMRSNLKAFFENMNFILDNVELLSGYGDNEAKQASKYWSDVMDLYLAIRKYKDIL